MNGAALSHSRELSGSGHHAKLIGHVAELQVALQNSATGSATSDSSGHRAYGNERHGMTYSCFSYHTKFIWDSKKSDRDIRAKLPLHPNSNSKLYYEVLVR
ncbi:hypothetical protein VNO78_10788 [Psophocarpus tetragonolobus]|uniref:Uncharacterized protein n=1 Tax=Psophocarpus tetragonolobus TaxID=3891 RepID=A0AAN9SLA6_PSOTE